MARTLLLGGCVLPTSYSSRAVSQAPEALHRRLASSHAARLNPRLDDVVRDEQDFNDSLLEHVAAARLEGDFVGRERRAVVHLIRHVPSDAAGAAIALDARFGRSA